MPTPVHRKNRSYMNPMKISLNNDKFTDRSFDLPLLMNPTPKETEPNSNNNFDLKRRELMSLSPSNPYSNKALNAYNNVNNNLLHNDQKNHNYRLKTLANDRPLPSHSS